MTASSQNGAGRETVSSALIDKRRRSRWRVLRFFRNRWTLGVAGLLMLSGSAYAAYWYRYYTDRPQLKRNFTAELNAPIQAIPHEQRAWPKYRTALKKLAPLNPKWESDSFHPTSNDWPDIRAYMEQHRAVWAEVREASRLQSLGHEPTDGISAEDAELLRTQPRAPSENPLLMSVLLPATQELRMAARWLLGEAHVAAAEGNCGLAATNLVAMCRMAEQLQEHLCTVNELAGLAIVSTALAACDEWMHKNPDALSDAELASLESAFARIVGGKIPLRLELNARMTMEDVIQRWYTDDGQGDGHAHLPSIGDEYWDRTPFWDKAMAPIASRKLATRKEITGELAAVLKLVRRETSTPPWELEELESRPRIIALCDSNRYPIFRIFQDIYSAYFTFHRVMQQCDGTRMGIAAARFRFRRGAWPAQAQDLVPEFLPEIPIDRTCGERMIYRLVDGQPQIYSRGYDRDDDRGKWAVANGEEMNAYLGMWRAVAEKPGTPIPDGDWPLFPRLPWRSDPVPTTQN